MKQMNAPNQVNNKSYKDGSVIKKGDQTSERISIKNVIKYSGAIIAFQIGSGFASGQEVIQFFSSYGPIFSLLGGLIALVILGWFISRVLLDAKRLKLEDSTKIFHYYCGRILGTVCEYAIPVFLFGTYVIMLAGSGALLNEYFGLPVMAGRILMAVLSLITVLLGLDRLVDVIGKIGPVIIVLVISIGLACILSNPQGIAEAAGLAEELNMTKASPSWWLSGLLYAGFSAVIMLPFLSGIGKNFQHDKEARINGFLSSTAFMAGAMILNYGMLAFISELYDKDVPSVIMANYIMNGLGLLFSLVMLAGIFTTAVPMLWTVSSKISPNEKAPLFYGASIELVLLALLCSNLKFSSLINIIYPYMGYFGLVILVCVFFRTLVKRTS